jgi:hypothetical protein
MSFFEKFVSGDHARGREAGHDAIPIKITLGCVGCKFCQEFW